MQYPVGKYHGRIKEIGPRRDGLVHVIHGEKDEKVSCYDKSCCEDFRAVVSHIGDLVTVHLFGDGTIKINLGHGA